MEERKLKEIEFHNKVRDMALREDEAAYAYYWSNRKFYSITRQSTEYLHRWLRSKARNARVLDYCCGDGVTSLWLAHEGFTDVTGIDISDTSIENCKRHAADEGVADQIQFMVMDAENLEFPDQSFDVILCAGVLHHLDLRIAFPELARVLKPDGSIICVEPLNYNPVIQWYRRSTPHLRTEWEAEHILRLDDLDLAQQSFGKVQVQFFHLASLAAVPLRNTPLFRLVLGPLEQIDNILLRLPMIQVLAWQMIFILTKPQQKSSAGSYVTRYRQSQILLSVSAAIAAVMAFLLWVKRSRKKD